MKNRDKEIRKMMVEKGFDSFDDLSERLNNLPEPSSAKDIEDKLVKLTNPQPLFTLTAEEVEMLEQIIGAALHTYRKTYIAFKNTCQANDWQNAINECNNLLTRVKEWQDENGTHI